MPCAAYAPQQQAVAIIADDGTRFAVSPDAAPAIAAALDHLHRVLHGQGRRSVRVAGNDWLKLDVADAPALAAAIRDAAAIPAHVATLTAEAAV